MKGKGNSEKSDSKNARPGNKNATRAEQNKAIRQEALREELAAQKLLKGIDQDLDNLETVRRRITRSKSKDRFESARTEAQGDQGADGRALQEAGQGSTGSQRTQLGVVWINS